MFGAPWFKDGMFFADDNPIFAPLTNAKVKDIIDKQHKVWNAPLIYNLFDNNTTQLVLNTPLQPLVTGDKLIWKAEKNGMYSVRSAYRICVTEIADNSRLHLPGRWKLIWRLKVPPKIKNLVWRVCRGCFPTRSRLSSKGMHCPINCVLCDSNYEDNIHVLLECPTAMHIWRKAHLWDKIDRALRQNYNIDAVSGGSRTLVQGVQKNSCR